MTRNLILFMAFLALHNVSWHLHLSFADFYWAEYSRTLIGPLPIYDFIL